MPTTTTFIPKEMGGTQYVKSRYINLNDNRDNIRYEYVGEAQQAYVKKPTEGAEDITIDTISANPLVDTDIEVRELEESTTVLNGFSTNLPSDAQKRREVARQAVLALIDGLSDDQLVVELAYLFRYQGSTDATTVDSPKRFVAKLKASLQELRTASDLDGVTVATGDDLYDVIAHGA